MTKKAKLEERGLLGDIPFSISRILNKAWEVVIEIHVEDKGKHTI